MTRYRFSDASERQRQSTIATTLLLIACQLGAYQLGQLGTAIALSQQTKPNDAREDNQSEQERTSRDPSQHVPRRGVQLSPLASRLVRKFETRYNEFAVQFRASEDVAARLEMVRESSRELNAMFAEHLDQPVMSEVLPRLVEARVVDLQPTFVEVIDEHPDPRVRAVALLSFAQYSGHNQRAQTRDAALSFLVKRYGSLPHGRTTFAKAAEETKYFFEHLAVGAEAPPTVGEDADGAVFRLSDYRGKVVMLRFWGDWCPACRRMYPFERKIVGQYKAEPFALVGVNSDSRQRCQQAQRESNLMWRSVWDGGTTNGPISRIYRVAEWPTIIVIDAEGRIRYRSQGLDEDRLSDLIATLVAEAREMANAEPASVVHRAAEEATQ